MMNSKNGEPVVFTSQIHQTPCEFRINSIHFDSPSLLQLSHDTTFPTQLHVHPARTDQPALTRAFAVRLKALCILGYLGPALRNIFAWRIFSLVEKAVQLVYYCRVGWG